LKLIGLRGCDRAALKRSREPELANLDFDEPGVFFRLGIGMTAVSERISG